VAIGRTQGEAQPSPDQTLETFFSDKEGFQMPTTDLSFDAHLDKRWFGTFKNWLTKITTVESHNKDNLPMGWKNSMLLYHATKGCQSSTAYAELSMYLDSDLDQRTRCRWTTLDVWGQPKLVIILSGSMQVGVRFNFEKSEWYWPEDADSDKYNELLVLENNPEPADTGLHPVLTSNVKASADLDVLVTPEANLGIKVISLFSAQLVAYVNTTLNFHADASGTIQNGETGWSYNYGVYLYYNLGIGATTSLAGYSWAATRHDLFNPAKYVKLCCDLSVESSGPDSNSQRGIGQMRDTTRRGMLNAASHDGFDVIQHKNGHSAKCPASVTQLNHSLSNSILLQRQSGAESPGSEQPEFSLSSLFDCPACKSYHPSQHIMIH
jgi:hypothetical protein